MRSISKILVAIDFSECSHALAHQAAQLAAQVDAELVFLHSVKAPSGLRASTKIFVEGKDEAVAVQDYLREDASRLLPAYVDQVANAEGVAATARVVVADPAAGVLEVAKDVQADMIVMGSHGRTGLNRMMLGSVSERVLREAEVPVLIVRSIHRPECSANSCATCASGMTDAATQARIELDG